MANGQEILICDDQPMIHETLGVYLENEGFTYCSAYDGERALQMFDSKKPDLVILDLMMPKKTRHRGLQGNTRQEPHAYNNAHRKGRGNRPHSRT